MSGKVFFCIFLQSPWSTLSHLLIVIELHFRAWFANRYRFIVFDRLPLPYLLLICNTLETLRMCRCEIPERVSIFQIRQLRWNDR